MASIGQIFFNCLLRISERHNESIKNIYLFLAYDFFHLTMLYVDVCIIYNWMSFFNQENRFILIRFISIYWANQKYNNIDISMQSIEAETTIHQIENT